MSAAEGAAPPGDEGWWRARATRVPLALLACYLVFLCQFHVSDAELARILGPSDRERPVGAVLERAGVAGALGLYFGVHEQIQLYHRYAEVAWRGRDPRREASDPAQGRLRAFVDVEIEYPPGKLLLMIPPALFSSDGSVYRAGFIAWSGFLYVAAVLAAIHAARDGTARGPTRALWWSLLMLILFGPYAAAHLDPAVALVCAMAWLSLRRGGRGGHPAWFGVAGALAGAGVFVKVAPAVLVPAAWLALLAVPARPRWRPAAWLTCGFVASLAALHALSLATWGDAYLTSYAFHLERGIHYESTWAGLLRAAGRAIGEPVAVRYDHGSYQLVTGLTPYLRPLFPLAWLGFAAVVAARARRGAAGPGRIDAADAFPLLTVMSLLALLATSGVFSFNYLLWLTPLVPALVDRVSPWLPLGPTFAVALGLTQLQRLFDYAHAKLDPPAAALALLNLRNLTLLALVLGLAWRLPRLLTAPPPSSSGRAAA